MAGAGADPGHDALAEELDALAVGDPAAAPAEPPADWAGGVPVDVLAKVAETLVAQNEAAWAAQHKGWGYRTEEIQGWMAKRKRDGNCLFVFALVCKEWRKAQLKVGGPLRTRVPSDVIAPGRVALVNWALAEGCPREAENGHTMAHEAAEHGHLELVQWLCGEGGFAIDTEVMDQAALGGHIELVQWLFEEHPPGAHMSFTMSEDLMAWAARSGNLELVKWLRGEGCDWGHSVCANAARSGKLEVLKWLRVNGCPWNEGTCACATYFGQVETLRWARANGAPWISTTRDRAAAKFGYTDDFGNLRM